MHQGVDNAALLLEWIFQLDEQGLAQLGFAAGRSEVGLEQYEIHEWWFKRNVDDFHGEERLSRRDEKVV